jgi:hypothetical protein
VAGAPIDTDWGQQVHDATFTPRGTRVAGGSSTAVGTVYEQLQLNTATDDPGGWLASDALTVPSGAGGLYLYTINMQTDNGDVGERTGIQLRVNGSALVAWFIDNNGTTAEFDGRSGLANMSAGDVITAYAKKSGGVDPDVLVRELSFVRLGSDMGA